MLVALAVWSCGHPLVAQSLWSNPGTGDWFSGTNWNTGLVPSTLDLARIVNGGLAQATSATSTGPMWVNRLEVGRDASAGSLTSQGVSLLSDTSFDIGEVTGGTATGGATISSNGTVLIQDAALLQIGVDGDGDLDVAQAGAALGGTANSTGSLTILRHGEISIATNLEVAPASASGAATSNATGQLTIDTADSLNVTAMFNVGTVGGNGTANSIAEVHLRNISAASIGGPTSVGTAAGLSTTGNVAEATLKIESSTVDIGFADALNLEDLNIGDVSTTGSGALHGNGTVIVNSSILTVGNRIDVARLSGGGEAATTLGRLEVTGSHVVADDLTAAELVGGVLGAATAVVVVDASLIELDSNLILGTGSSLEMALAGSTRATGEGGAQYAAIDAANATLAGTLNVSLVGGYVPTAGASFLLIDSPAIAGSFSSIQLPELTGGLAWQVDASATAFRLTVVSPGIAGDFNNDGTVNLADYAVWRDTLGSTVSLAADGNGNNVVDSGDYTVWKNNFGQTTAFAAMPTTSSVPEPATASIAIGAMILLAVSARTSGASR